MLRRKTRSLKYAEYVPLDKVASGQAWLARLEVIETVRRLLPEFLDRLSVDVFPLYERSAKHGYNFDAILWATKSPYKALPEGELKSALSKWAAQFNADPCWLKDEALRTLRKWYVAADEYKSRSWNTIHGRRLAVVIGDDFNFSCKGWETTLLRWSEYRKSVTRRFEEQLLNYEKQTRKLAESKGLVCVNRKYSPRDLEWFVLYQFAGMSSKQIADDSERAVEDSTVLKGVKAAAKLIGWDELRKPKSRPSRKIR